VSANGIHTPNRLAAGAVLRIPDNEGPARHDREAKSPSHARRTIEYVVRSGDSLFKIARRFATTTERIQRLNNMATTRLSVGQVLKIQTTAGLTDEA
jgi:LysM repeat protein